VRPDQIDLFGLPALPMGHRNRLEGDLIEPHPAEDSGRPVDRAIEGGRTAEAAGVAGDELVQVFVGGAVDEGFGVDGAELGRGGVGGWRGHGGRGGRGASGGRFRGRRGPGTCLSPGDDSATEDESDHGYRRPHRRPQPEPIRHADLFQPLASRRKRRIGPRATAPIRPTTARGEGLLRLG